jgi:polysaccharide chain length determinant protein (PEP-CTERM system associated)
MNPAPTTPGTNSDPQRPEFLVIGAGPNNETEGATARPQFSPFSLIQTAWKQKVIILSVWFVFSILAVAVVRFLPLVYKAEALVLLESQSIPANFVSPTTVRSDLVQRLNSLNEQVQSYPQLLEIINTVGLYAEESKTESQDKLVERMRKDISVDLDQGFGRTTDRPQAFRVGYSGPEPQTVALVANRLAHLFIEQDLRASVVESSGTAEFLESQLEEARVQLETQEARLGRYKLEHNGELPEQEGALLGTLSRLQSQLQANQDGIRQAEQDRFFARNSLEVAVSSARDLRAISQRPDTSRTVVDSEAGARLEDPTIRSIRTLRNDLIELRQRYTETHPEVVKAEETLKRLELAAREQQASNAATRAQLEAAEGAAKSATPEISQGDDSALDSLLEPELQRRVDQIRQFQTQIKSLDNRIETLQSGQSRLLAAIADADRQVQKLPIREQEMAALIRDYEITKNNYQSLLRKRMDAGLAMEMEKRQKSEKLVLLASARVPTEPIKPKVLILSLGGSGIGLVLGLILGAGRELKKNVFLGEWELPSDLTVMGRVPTFAVGATEKTSLSFRRIIAVSSILALLLVLGMGAVELQGGWPTF